MPISCHRQLLRAAIVLALPFAPLGATAKAQALSSFKATSKPPASVPAKKGARTARSARSKSSRRRSQSIVVLVNDQPITGYDLKQRAGLLAMQGKVGKQAQANFKNLVRSASAQRRMRSLQREVIQGNPGKSREQLIAIFRKRQKAYAMGLQRQAVNAARAGIVKRMKRRALDELIDESLQGQSAKKLNIVISNAQVDKVLTGLASRNKMTLDQFAAHIKKSGANISTMRARMKAKFAWRKMINRKFGMFVSINDAQVDDVIAASNDGSAATVELQIQRITLSLPANDDQRILVQRFAEAERMRKRFRNCKSMAGLAKGVAHAKYEKLGMRKPATFPEPARTMLLSARDGQMTAPSLLATGIEFYAICGRRTVKGDEKKRAQTQASLRQKEFAILARRHMRDLRTDAHICRRSSASYMNHLAPCS